MIRNGASLKPKCLLVFKFSILYYAQSFQILIHTCNQSRLGYFPRESGKKDIKGKITKFTLIIFSFLIKAELEFWSWVIVAHERLFLHLFLTLQLATSHEQLEIGLSRSISTMKMANTLSQCVSVSLCPHVYLCICKLYSIFLLLFSVTKFDYIIIQSL